MGCREDGRIVATLTNKDSTEVVTGDLAVNCLGLAPNIKAARSALLDDLLDKGLVCPNQLGLGLLVSSNGEVCDRQGLPAKNLFTLGSMRRGELAETTSMPDIRVQAQQVARALVSSI